MHPFLTTGKYTVKKKNPVDFYLKSCYSSKLPRRDNLSLAAEIASCTETDLCQQN